jgi:hypothetical protein
MNMGMQQQPGMQPRPLRIELVKEHSGVPADRFDFSHCMKLASNTCGCSLSIFAAHLDTECMLNDMHFLHSPDTLRAVLLCLDCC